MTQKDVEIGGYYRVKVSHRMTTVRIVGRNAHKGWDGINTATGRECRIRTAAKLRERVR